MQLLKSDICETVFNSFTCIRKVNVTLPIEYDHLVFRLCFIFLKFNIFYLCVYVCNMSSGNWECQNKLSDLLKMEIKIVMSHMTWLLGARLETYERARCALKC